MTLTGSKFPWKHKEIALVITQDWEKILISISTREGFHYCFFNFHSLSPLFYRGVEMFLWLRFSVSHEDAAGHSRDPQREGCHAGRSDKDEGNAHQTMKGNRILSQSPFIWTTVTSPLRLQCPITFFWYLGLSTFLFYCAHLPWCISYLQGKNHLCNSKKESFFKMDNRVCR